MIRAIPLSICTYLILAKSKIPVRIVKNVISKWTKMEFPRFLSLWFTAVAVVNPPDQKLVIYTSLKCRKGVNCLVRTIKTFYPSPETWKKNPVWTRKNIQLVSNREKKIHFIKLDISNWRIGKFQCR